MKGFLHALYLMPAIVVILTLFPIAYLLAAVRICWILANDLVKETAKNLNGGHHGF